MYAKKICHMTSAHPQEDVRIFYKECLSLSKAGYEVYLVERGESYEKNGVKIIGVGEISKSRFKRMLDGAKKVYEAALALNCDIYHFHDPELLHYALKLKRKGKKVIFDSHENTANAIRQKEYMPKWICWIVSSLYSFYEKQICKKIDAVISVTPTMTEYFQRFANTVEIRNYPIVSDQYIPLSFKKKALVFAGQIDKQWNHHNIIKAIENNPECGYVLCGEDNAYRRSLENLPAWSQVDYKGKIPHQEVSIILSECMVGMALLAPSRNTAWMTGTMGNTKIFEEMMAGLPVICTNFDLWREFVQERNCGICIDPNNIEMIAEAINKLINDPKLAKEMGMNGRQAVIDTYNWNTQIPILIGLYKKIGS